MRLFLLILLTVAIVNACTKDSCSKDEVCLRNTCWKKSKLNIITTKKSCSDNSGCHEKYDELCIGGFCTLARPKTEPL